MNTCRLKSKVLPALLFGAGLAFAGPAFAQGAGGFVKVRSHHSFAATVGALKRAVSHNKMMVLGHLNQANVLSVTGLHLAGAQSFFVGNPEVGKQAFGMNPAAGAELPARVTVWSDHGKTYIGYFKPSTLLGDISQRFPKKMAGMLDRKLAMIAQDASK